MWLGILKSFIYVIYFIYILYAFWCMYVIKSVLDVLGLLSLKPQCYADSASTNCFLKFAFVS